LTYLLHDVPFDNFWYFRIVRHEILIQEIARLPNADQRAVALQYMNFEQLGTKLYRLELPQRLARDRRTGYGRYDYFIHMRDASHPERQFIEWVDPEIGRLRNAELCQARAFGISLGDWLSIEQEG
jgi:hypothetical protein